MELATLTVWSGNRQPGVDRHNKQSVAVLYIGARERPGSKTERPCNLETAGKTAVVVIKTKPRPLERTREGS